MCRLFGCSADLAHVATFPHCSGFPTLRQTAAPVCPFVGYFSSRRDRDVLLAVPDEPNLDPEA
jgi:hypothetical protein